jgi:ubiquitin C-terminal hydrolase
MALHHAYNDSIVVKLFHGETCTSLQYRCGMREDIHEPLASWALPLPSGRKSVTLKDCVKLWEQEHTLIGDNGVWCDRCGMVEDVRRKVRVVKFAPVLIVQLKRFTNSRRGELRKNDVPVSYPNEIDSADFADHPTGIYDLTGVICHSGSLVGGHYTCRVRDPENMSQWYYISDSYVSPCGSGTSDSGAMTLIYQSRQK